MLRLLQGDVGSGKTLVAALAMLVAVEGRRAGGVARADRNSRTTALRDRCGTLLGGLPIEVAVLTGRDKGRVREGDADGARRRDAIHILIGTHAIFQETVAYK